MRALVVEDDVVARRLLEHALSERGHEVVAVADAESALDLHRVEPFALMIVDWHLPGMDGLELCRRVRGAPGGNDVAIVVATGSDRAEDLLDALNAGASDYLAKPLGPSALRTRLIVAERMAQEAISRRQMQARLVVADRMASVGTLAAGVAHEINNPLAFVIANLEVLGEEVPLLGIEPVRAMELATIIKEARSGAERIRIIVRELRTFSSASDDTLGPVDPNRVAERALAMAGNEIRHRARLVKRLSPVPPVLASEARLGQVILHLLVNAAHAMPEGAAHDNEIRIVTGRDDAGRVVIEVGDTGAGIPPEVLPRIFDPFFTTRPAGTAMGMGLAVCHGIVTGLKGEITALSNPGGGSRFVVVLPPAPVLSAAADAGPARPASRIGRSRVLVIDDEPLVGSVARRALGADYDVLTLLGAREALEHLTRGERFDVILCDVMLPEMSGPDFCRALDELAPEQLRRVVFMTGGAFTPATEAFLDSVPNARLDKPFDLNELRQVVRRIADQDGGRSNTSSGHSP